MPASMSSSPADPFWNTLADSFRCYCDNGPQNYAMTVGDGCDMSCQGSSDEICGGPSRLTVYQYNSTGVTTASPTTTTGGGAGGTTATSTPIPTPSTSVNASAIYPFVYQGCYTDQSADGRTMLNEQPDNSTLTIESCISMCSSLGYTIAGAEYGDVSHLGIHHRRYCSH